MSQVPYPPLVAPLIDDLAVTDKATTEEIHRTPSLITFIALWQRGMVGTLLVTVLHPASDLLQSYTEGGILVNTLPPWSMEALDNAIKTFPHM